MSENPGSDDKLETRALQLGEPKRRAQMAPPAAFSMAEEDFEARQAAIGERRRYAGPVFDQAAPMPAAFDAAMADEDVEPTEIKPPPAAAESESADEDR